MERKNFFFFFNAIGDFLFSSFYVKFHKNFHFYRVDTNTERISDGLLLRLFETSEPLCGDNDKVRTNAARILGNLLRLITSDHIKSQKWQSKCCEAIRRLIDQAKLQGGSLNMKVKWNACYAIGNFMKNPGIFEIEHKDFNWQVSSIALESIDKL